VKLKQVMWLFLLSLLALAVTACSGGSGKTSSASVSVKFVEKIAAKTVGAVPANVHRVSISATPSNPANPVPAPIDISFDLHASAQYGIFNPLVDGETYTFEVWAYDLNDVPVYFGSATQLMQPGDNIVNIICNPYTPPAPSASAPVWTAKTAMPTARSRAASAMVNGVIYVIGGQDAGGAAVNTLEMYNPASNSWTSGSPIPNPRRYAAAVAVMSDIYVIGGEDTNGFPVEWVDVLNTQTGAWSTHSSPMPTPRAQLACVAHNGLIYAIGGTDAAFTPLTTVEEFNPSQPFNSWLPRPSLNTARASFSAVIAKDQSGNAIISVLGGVTPAGPTSSQEIFTLTPTPAASWSNGLSLPAARTRQASVIAGNSGYIIGGEDAAEALVSAVWSYDFVSAPQSFGTLSLPLPTPRAYPAVQAVDGRLYVIGGEVASGTAKVASNAVEELSPAGALPRIGKISLLAGLATVSDASLNGSNLLLVGQQALNGPLFAQMVNASGTTAAAPVALNITPIIASEPDAVMAVGGGRYLVVSPEAGGLYVSSLDAANPTAVLNKVRLDGSQPAGTSSNACVSYNGSTFLVVWNNSGVLYGRFVDLNGNPTTAENSYGSGTLQGAGFGGNIHLVITGRVQGPNVIIDGTVITPGSTTAAPSAPLFSAAGSEYDGNLGPFNGSQFGVAVAVGDAVNKAVYATAVRFNGINLAPSPAVMLTPASGNKDSINSAWDGFKWAVSWFEIDAVGNETGFYRFLDTNGTPLGAAVSFAPNLGSNGGGQIWWSDSLSSYLLAWGSPTAGYSMAPLQP